MKIPVVSLQIKSPTAGSGSHRSPWSCTDAAFPRPRNHTWHEKKQGGLGNLKLCVPLTADQVHGVQGPAPRGEASPLPERLQGWPLRSGECNTIPVCCPGQKTKHPTKVVELFTELYMRVCVCS